LLIDARARIEVASKVLGIQEAQVDEDRYLKVIHGHIAPLVRDVAVEKKRVRFPEREHVPTHSSWSRD